MANRYLVSGGNGQWDSVTNWSATSGGAAGASFPVAADAVIFDSASANANINVDVASACLNITASNYTGTLTINSQLSCVSGFTFSTGMTCAGTGSIVITTTPTITSNGVVFLGTLFAPATNGAIVTMTDTLTVGTLNFQGTSGTVILNGGTINAKSLVSTTVTSKVISGTTNLVLTGTGTVNFPVAWAGAINNNLTINSTSTTFINNFRYAIGILSYIAGTVDTSACSLILTSGCTLGTSGMSWSNVFIDVAANITLTSNLNVVNLSPSANSQIIAFSGSFVINTGTLNIRGTNNLTLNGSTINTNSLISTSITSSIINGTTELVLTGTGTVNLNSLVWSGSIANNLTINSTSTTFINNFRYITGTLRYIAGTVDTSACTLVLVGSCTLNTDGMSWVSISAPSVISTITLASNLNISGTLFTTTTNGITYTFSGSFVVNTNTLNIQGTTGSITLNGGTINTDSLVSTTLTSRTIVGTTKIVLTGIGTVNFPVAWTGSIANNIDINSTNTTFTNIFRYITGTLRYIAGTVNTSASTLVLAGSCTLNTADLEWNNITIAATLTLTLTSAFTCSGTFTINAALTIVGTGFWTRVGNLTFIASSNILALLNNLTVTGTLTPAAGTTTINGSSLLISSLNLPGSSVLGGTTTIVFNGTGTWSGTGVLTNNTTINTSGTLTISSDYARFRVGTLTYTAGIVDSSAGGLYCLAACTLNCSGMTWAAVLLTGTITLASNLNVTNTRITGTTTFVNANRFTETGILSIENLASFTLINNITVTGTFQSVNNASNQIINGFQVICNGGITTTGTGTIAGTTTILLNGTGTWTAPTESDTNALRNNTTINTTGTIVFAGYPQFNTGTLTYTAGTVVTAGSELRFWANTTLNTAGISWDIVSFAGIITLSSNLTVTNTAKIIAGTTFVGVNRFTQVPVLELINAATLALINNITVTNTFKSLNNGSVQNMSGFQLICNGSITTTGTGVLEGSTSILLNGTGTWTSDSSDILVTSNAIRNNTTINTTGTITFEGKASFNTGTLTYVAGTVVTTGSTLCCNLATTLNTVGITWNNLLLSGVATLSSNLSVTGTTIILGTVSITPTNRLTQTGNLQLHNTAVFTLPNNINVLGNISTVGSTGQHTINGFELTVSAGLDLSATSGIIGTTALVLNGTGTWSGAAVIKNNLTINTAGTITVSGHVAYNTGTLTHVAGTVVTTSSKLSIANSTTLNTTGISWWNIDLDGSFTLTLASILRVNNALTLNGLNLIFAGTAGVNCNYLYQTITGQITLVSTIDYIISSGFVSEISNNVSRSLFKSSIPTSKAILTLEPSATQSIGYVNATDIDSSAGQKLWSFKGVLNNADNWEELTAVAAESGGGGSTITGGSYTWVA
jgi:hypothetical protein